MNAKSVQVKEPFLWTANCIRWTDHLCHLLRRITHSSCWWI